MRAISIGLVCAMLALAGCVTDDADEGSGVTLRWMPPSEYDDGGEMPPGAVTEYRIYVDGEMVQRVEPERTEYFLELSPGTYEVSISAVAGGIESRLSAALNVVVD